MKLLALCALLFVAVFVTAQTPPAFPKFATITPNSAAAPATANAAAPTRKATATPPPAIQDPTKIFVRFFQKIPKATPDTFEDIFPGDPLDIKNCFISSEGKYKGCEFVDYREGNAYFRLFANFYIKDKSGNYVATNNTVGQDLFLKVSGVYVPITKVAYELKVQTFNKIEKAGDVRITQFIISSSPSGFDVVPQSQETKAVKRFIGLDGLYIDTINVETTKPNNNVILYHFDKASSRFLVASADTVAELFVNIQTIFVPISRVQYYIQPK